MDAAPPSLEDEVIALVAYETGVCADRIHPQMTLFGDIGIDGDDAVDLLQHFEQKFGVDMTACRLNLHFGPEGLFPWAPLYWFLLAWRALVEKGSTPESRARLTPICVQDLINSAKSGKWVLKYEDQAHGLNP